MESSLPKSSDLLVSFAIGRNVARYNASDTKGAQQLSNAIEYGAVELARKNTLVDVKRLTERLKQTVETAYTEAVRFAASRMMGRTSRRAWGKDPDPVILLSPSDTGDRGKGTYLAEWRPLSRRQIKEQGGPTASTGKFFVHTGKLRTEMMGMARQMVKNTGVIKVQIKDHEKDTFRSPLRSTKTVPVADLRITLMPKIYPSQLPGLLTGDVDSFTPKMSFEKALGLSDDAITKLRGPVIPGQPDLYHRPLLQPVFTYWTLYRIPNIIQDAFTRGIVNTKRANNSGIADYSSS